MADIKVLLADQDKSKRDYYRRILSESEEIMVVGEVAEGDKLFLKVKELLPDILLINKDLSRKDGFLVSEKVSVEYPQIGVILYGENADLQDMKKALTAGVSDFLLDPVDEKNLADDIKKVSYQKKTRSQNLGAGNKNKKKSLVPEAQIISVVSAKGGTGKSMLATNLAIQIARRSINQVALVDLDLQFGDISLLLNLNNKRSIAELVQEIEKMDLEILEKYLLPHSSRIKVLAAPKKPEYAELVYPEHIAAILTLLKEKYDYVIVDTNSVLDDRLISALEISSKILMPLTLDITTIKDAKLCLEIFESLHFKDKTFLVLNKASDNFGINEEEMKKALDFPISARIASDSRTIVSSFNKGVPFVMDFPNMPISKSINEIAQLVMKNTMIKPQTEKKKKEHKRGNLFHKS